MSKLTKEEQVIKTIENSDEQIKIISEKITEYERDIKNYKLCIEDLKNKLDYKNKVSKDLKNQIYSKNKIVRQILKPYYIELRKKIINQWQKEYNIEADIDLKVVNRSNLDSLYSILEMIENSLSTSSIKLERLKASREYLLKQFRYENIENGKIINIDKDNKNIIVQNESIILKNYNDQIAICNTNGEILYLVNSNDFNFACGNVDLQNISNMKFYETRSKIAKEKTISKGNVELDDTFDVATIYNDNSVILKDVDENNVGIFDENENLIEIIPKDYTLKLEMINKNNSRSL